MVAAVADVIWLGTDSDTWAAYGDAIVEVEIPDEELSVAPEREQWMCRPGNPIGGGRTGVMWLFPDDTVCEMHEVRIGGPVLWPDDIPLDWLRLLSGQE